MMRRRREEFDWFGAAGLLAVLASAALMVWIFGLVVMAVQQLANAPCPVC